MTDNPVLDQPVQSEMPKANYSITEGIFALIFTFVGFFFVNTFFYGVGFTSSIFLLALCTASMIMVKICKASQSKKSLLFFIGAVVFSTNIAITSNGLIQFLDLVYAAMLYAMWAFSINNPSFNGADDNLIYSLSTAIFGASFGNIGRCPSAALSLAQKSKGGKNIGNAIIGLIIALPVTLVVISLLSSADDIFDGYIQNILDGIVRNFFKGILKYVLALPISFLIFGIIFSGIKNKGESRLDPEKCKKTTASFRIAPSVVMYSSVVPLCLVYILFFFSQISYFVSAFKAVLPEEYSAAEYARKGFFELCAVAVINLSVIAAINLLCKYSEDDPQRRPKGLSFFTILLSSFTLILIATALSKMFMYISRFGLTALRVYTTWFMFLLTALFVLIIIRQCKRINLAKIGTIIFTVMLGLLSFSSTDTLIANYNINHGYDLYDSNFSCDAVYAFAPLLESDNPELKEDAEFFITVKLRRIEDVEWYKMSLSEYVVYCYGEKYDLLNSNNNS